MEKTKITVKELIEELKKYPENAHVWIFDDSSPSNGRPTDISIMDADIIENCYEFEMDDEDKHLSVGDISL